MFFFFFLVWCFRPLLWAMVSELPRACWLELVVWFEILEMGVLSVFRTLPICVCGARLLIFFSVPFI